MRNVILFLLLHLCAAITPLVLSESSDLQATYEDAAIAPLYDGVILTELPLSSREREFSRGFPGRIRRFTDGEHEIIIREVNRPTRKLHPSSDCFRGAGFDIKPQPAKVDTKGRTWGCFSASRTNEKLKVCEHISSSAGDEWYDVSSWFWAALFQDSRGPWVAYTVVEKT